MGDHFFKIICYAFDIKKATYNSSSSVSDRSGIKSMGKNSYDARRRIQCNWKLVHDPFYRKQWNGLWNGVGWEVW